mmetsp:Transcript_45529/g.71221  ORF Transcript_45529/g.71221 Transcript_45529/m.71221 type:complete len:227 (+) Transcript_45529:226-906(+)
MFQVLLPIHSPPHSSFFSFFLLFSSSLLLLFLYSFVVVVSAPSWPVGSVFSNHQKSTCVSLQVDVEDEYDLCTTFFLFSVFDCLFVISEISSLKVVVVASLLFRTAFNLHCAQRESIFKVRLQSSLKEFLYQQIQGLDNQRNQGKSAKGGKPPLNKVRQLAKCLIIFFNKQAKEKNPAVDGEPGQSNRCKQLEGEHLSQCGDGADVGVLVSALKVHAVLLGGSQGL